MPLYEFLCSQCGRKTAEWRKIEGRDNLPLCTCRGIMKRLISRPQLITAPTRFQDDNRFNETFYPGLTEAEIKEERRREDTAYEEAWGRLEAPERDTRPPDEMTLLDLPMTDQTADETTLKWLEGS